MVNICRGMFHWVTNARTEYMKKSPLEKWLFVRKVNIWLCKVGGCAFMEPNYKPSFLTLIPAWVQLSYYVLAIYTIYYYFDDPKRALTATTPVGLYVPSLVMFLLIFIPSIVTKYRQMYNFAGEYIYANNGGSPKHRYVCDQMAIDLVKSSARVMSLLMLSFQFIVIMPIYKSLFTDQREYPIPVILPFLDPDTNTAYYISLVTQYVSSLFGAVIIPASELVVCIMKNTVTAMAAVIANNLEEFQNDLNIDESFTANRVWKFRNIILQIMDFNRFINEMTDIYYWKFFLQPFFLMYAITVSIGLYLVGSWISLIGCAICCYIQLLILCDVGMAVDNANSMILDAFDQFSFYLLPLKKQEMFSLTMSYLQNGPKCHMGPFVELNYETAAQQTKTIYSYLMCMLKAIKN